MQTAKNFQLTDQNGVQISPMTDLASVYYEVETEDGVIARKHIYNDFPVGVNYSSEEIKQLSVSTATISPLTIKNDQKMQCQIDGQLQDIYVADVSVVNFTGTNYKMLKSNNYNLSEILFNYESKYAANTSFVEIENNTLTNITQLTNDYNSSFNDLSTRIGQNEAFIGKINSSLIQKDNQITNVLNTCGSETIKSRQQLLSLLLSNSLIANKIYDVELPIKQMNINIISSTTNIHEVTISNMRIDPSCNDVFVFYLRANSKNTFDEEVCSAYTVAGGIATLFEGEIRYDIAKNTVTYMKDKFRNEAPYDFKHAVANVRLTDISNSQPNPAITLHTFSSYDSGFKECSDTGKIKNVNIYANDSSITHMPVFVLDTSMDNVKCDLAGQVVMFADYIKNADIKNSDFILSTANNIMSAQYKSVISDVAVKNSNVTIENTINVLNNKVYKIINTDIINSSISMAKPVNGFMQSTPYNNFIQLSNTDIKNSIISSDHMLTQLNPHVITCDRLSILNSTDVSINANTGDVTLSNVHIEYADSNFTLGNSTSSESYYLNQNLYALDISTY